MLMMPQRTARKRNVSMGYLAPRACRLRYWPGPRRRGGAQEYLPAYSRNRCAEDHTRCDKQGCARDDLSGEAGHDGQCEQNGHERRSLCRPPPCAGEEHPSDGNRQGPGGIQVKARDRAT